MKRKNKISLILSGACMIIFAFFTLLVKICDLKPIGPLDSTVGMAFINGPLHELIGVNMTLYTVTDWLSLIPIAFIFGFALLGLIQWIKRRRLLSVDRDILLLGVFYIIFFGAYFIFELVDINYRPTLIDGVLEASYPSSTTMLVITVMSTAAIQLKRRIRHKALSNIAALAIGLFSAFMVTGRLISGVHWFTDIIGGLLLSSSIVLFYTALYKKD